MSGQPIPPRGKPSEEGHFAWQAGTALEKIHTHFGATRSSAGINVYVALTRRSARQKNDPRITASVAEIAGMARLSYRTAIQVLHDLAKISVIAIEENRTPGRKTQDHSTYILLSTRLQKSKSAKFEKSRQKEHSDSVHTEKPDCKKVSLADCKRGSTSFAENDIDTPVGSSIENTSSPVGSADSTVNGVAAAGGMKKASAADAIGNWGEP